MGCCIPFVHLALCPATTGWLISDRKRSHCILVLWKGKAVLGPNQHLTHAGQMLLPQGYLPTLFTMRQFPRPALKLRPPGLSLPRSWDYSWHLHVPFLWIPFRYKPRSLGPDHLPKPSPLNTTLEKVRITTSTF